MPFHCLAPEDARLDQSLLALLAIRQRAQVAPGPASIVRGESIQHGAPTPAPAPAPARDIERSV